MGWTRRNFNESGFSDLIENTSFLRLFSGRVITDAGDSMYFIGTMWLVWELTGSVFYTGLATALVRVPDLLNIFVGPLVDRWQLRRLLLSTQLINGIGVLLVPIAALTGHLSVWLVLTLIPILYFINGFVYPAQNAALPQIVGEGQLTRANSLFSTTIRTVDMVANAVAGAIIAVVGGVALFVIDSITFAIAAVLFFGVTVPKTVQDSSTGDGTEDDETKDNELNADSEGYVAELREGINYTVGSKILRSRYLQLRMTHLEGITGDDLRQILAEVEGKQATQRVMVGLNYKSGLTQRRLAVMYGVTEKTIYNWLCRLDRLADEPVEEVVYDADRSGRPSKLTDTEHERLERALLQPPAKVGYDASAWTPTLVQRYIAETFDVDYCLRQIRTLMTEAGLSYKTVRPENQDADPRAQETWQEGFKKSTTIWMRSTRS